MSSDHAFLRRIVPRELWRASNDWSGTSGPLIIDPRGRIKDDNAAIAATKSLDGHNT